MLIYSQDQRSESLGFKQEVAICLSNPRCSGHISDSADEELRRTVVSLPVIIPTWT